MTTLLVADLFCGAGGSSTGARRALEALGMSMRLVAVNHWDVAIETHTLNHPDAKHLCSNVYRLQPSDAVPGGRLDLLMASPTCTYFSRARGGKPTSRDQRYGRMTPTQVVRWVTELEVRSLIVENVPEFVRWGPVHRAIPCKACGKPLPREDRCPECGAAGVRVYRRGLKRVIPDGCRVRRFRCRPGRPCKRREGTYFRAWLRKLERAGFRHEHRVLNAADYGEATTRKRFFLIGRSDGGELAWPTPTHSRDGSSDLFDAGSERWRPAREIIDWSIKGRSIFTRKRPLSKKTLERIYAGAEKFGWPEPFLVILRRHMDGQSVDGPIPTLCAGGTHVGLAEPVVFQVNQGRDRKRNMRSASEEPLQTVLTRHSLGLAQPVVLRTDMHKSNARCVRGVDEAPVATITTGGGMALAQPFVFANRTNNAPKAPESDPIPCATTAHGGGVVLVEPFVLSRHSGGAPRPVAEPTPTQVAKHSHALITPYHGKSKPKRVSDPLPTATTRDRFGLVVPVTHADASRRARDLGQPLPTVTGANRGELAFISAAFGERRGQAPRVRSVERPAPTLCAQGRVNLVRAGEGFDILFRMLEPHELAAAMGFIDGDEGYEFAGTKTDVIKQIGNAVSVRTAEALVGALLGAE